MAFISFVLTAMLGFVIGIFLYAQLLLPLVYSFPRSLYLFYRGKLKITGVLVTLLTPVIWSFLLIAAGFILQGIFPLAITFALTNAGFNFGQWLSIAALFLNFFSPKGREDMDADFQRVICKRFSKL